VQGRSTALAVSVGYRVQESADRTVHHAIHLPEFVISRLVVLFLLLVNHFVSLSLHGLLIHDLRLSVAIQSEKLIAVLFVVFNRHIVKSFSPVFSWYNLMVPEILTIAANFDFQS